MASADSFRSSAAPAKNDSAMNGRASAHHRKSRIRSNLACSGVAGVVIAVGVALSMAAPATAEGAPTSRVSTSSSGGQGSGSSGEAAISTDGRYVAFLSEASNLVAGDTNDLADVFVRDLPTARVTRVSQSSSGVQGNGTASFPAISSDGRYVAYTSTASNLVPQDINESGDVFVHDRRTGTVARISVSDSGAQGNSWSSSPEISANGRYITFQSDASNLVAADTNDGWDQFVRDRRAGTTTRVALSDTDRQIPGGAVGARSAATAGPWPGSRTRPTWCTATPIR
jgi:Tol biopolymer transport system component